MKAVILGIVLAIQAFWDIKHKEIPVVVSLVGGILGIGFCLYEKREIVDVLLAGIPGGVGLLFGKISNETMGYGDGILLFIMGFYASLEKILSICMMAFSIAGLTALVLLVCFRKKGNYEIPFVPFLFVAYGIDSAMRIGELGI